MFNKDSSRTLFYIAGFVLTSVGQSGLCVCGGEGWMCGGVGVGQSDKPLIKKKRWLDVWNGCRLDCVQASALKVRGAELEHGSVDASVCECDQLSDFPRPGGSKVKFWCFSVWFP